MSLPAQITLPRVRPASASTNPSQGIIIWSPVKSLWFTSHLLVAAIGGWFTIGPAPVLLAFGFTVVTLCLGHTVGLHRLLIHRAFACPRWLEYTLVHLGVVVGMGGPFRMLYLHDIRDWAQRHATCHPFFSNQASPWRDWFWQTHCELRLEQPPIFRIEPAVRRDPVYRFMQSTWMLQQLPWALLLFWLAGIGAVVWGVSVRIVVSLTGHWFVGWLAHNVGECERPRRDRAAQGYNLPRLGLITMGEGWHNNHHAFPESARLGHRRDQSDPGWWAIMLLRHLGLIWNVNDATRNPHDSAPTSGAAPKCRPHARRRTSACFDLL